MSKTMALTSRELKAYLFSPIAYVALAVFLAFTSFFSSHGDFQAGKVAELRVFFVWANWVLVFVVPVLTMRLVSEEMQSGTIETLMTAPVTDAQVILGKFLGAMAFAALMLSATLTNAGVMATFASPDPGPIVAGYLGLLLVTSTYVAVGLLVSTCTRFQFVSALVSLVVLVAMTFLVYYLGSIAEGSLRRALWFVGFQMRYDNFTRGTLQLPDVVYFLSITAVALFLSVKILESRKWRG